MALHNLIAEQIADSGPISFHDFMEISLYHPAQGYYTTAGEKIGKDGDFYTAPWLTTLFGESIATQLEEMWEVLGRNRFTIVEYGAGTGILCRDILNKLKDNLALYENLQYFIIEKSKVMQQKEKALLGDKVRWIDSLEELTPFEGCILSNELLDNFSIHQVVMGQQLMEVFVDWKQDAFVECLRPASTELLYYFKQLNVTLTPGFRTEINLEAVDWLSDVARGLNRGFVLTIDYGYPSSELYSTARNSGTLTCYHRHKINYSPFEHVGEQDITAHINFSALRLWGEAVGLKFGAFTNQAYFLQGLGLATQLRRMEECGAFDNWTAQDRLWMVRTLLVEMGDKFKILFQYKGLQDEKDLSAATSPILLSGFQFNLNLP